MRGKALVCQIRAAAHRSGRSHQQLSRRFKPTKVRTACAAMWQDTALLKAVLRVLDLHCFYLAAHPGCGLSVCGWCIMAS